MPQFFKIRFFIAVFAVVIFGFHPPASAGENGKTSPRILVESGTGLVSLEAHDVEIAELLRTLAEKTETAIAISPGVSGKITVNISAATIGDVLKAIGQNSAIEYEYQPDTRGWRVLRSFAFSGANGKDPKSLAEDRQAGAFTPANVTSVGNTPSASPGRETRPAYKTGELLVKFRDKAAPEEIAALHARLGSVVIRIIPHIRVQRIRLKAGMDENTALLEYRNSAIVEHAERHALRYPQVIPNDPGYASQWGMEKISAETLWNMATGNSEIIVAVIDSGVDYTHPDLQGNIWINTVEQNGLHGVDDDQNGYVDDFYGWDFAGTNGTGDNDPLDSYGHGTHVAGIIGATGNNGIGVTGLNWTVRIMPLKVMEDSSEAFTEDAIIEAMHYAAANGARIVNCSFGGPEYSQNEYDAYDRLRAAGIIAGVAAGNGNLPSTSVGFDMDDPANVKIYPACYDLDNIISVASSNSSDTLATSSNYGKTTVDVAAPGESIYSTVPLSGTTASVKTVDASPAVEYPALGMEYAPLTEAEGITGALYDCGMGYSGYICETDLIDQIPDAVAGNIALIQRGNCDGQDFYFSQKVANAMGKGATGVIIYNNLEDDPDDNDNFDTQGGTLGAPGSWIPVVSISKAAGEDLLTLLSTGPQRVALINKPTENPYGYKGGTSMAAPHVAGLAGMIFGQCPSVGYAAVRDAIINNVDKIAGLTDKVASGGRINAYAALTSLFPPGDLSADCRIGLEDAIIALRILSDTQTSLTCPPASCRLDVNGDGLIGLEEAIYILQTLTGIR